MPDQSAHPLCAERCHHTLLVENVTELRPKVLSEIRVLGFLD